MGTLVLLRHGESAWNVEGRFTGWVDVGLTPVGEREAERAAQLMRDHGLVPAVVHTSVLTRARTTCEVLLEELGAPATEVHCHWRLNERHYGALQGMRKAEVLERYGADCFRSWRRSYDVRPPPIARGHQWDVRRDRPYAGLRPQMIPRTESLADVTDRLLPYWREAIAADVRARGVVLVVAHSNSLRALVAHLDGLGRDEVLDLNIPTGQPLRYDLGDDLVPIRRGGEYLDPQEARASAAAVAREGQRPTRVATRA